MTHGGILSTILDEAMSWAITNNGDIGVTTRMSITFRRPARVGEELRVVSQLTKRRGRLIEAMAEITEVESGDTIAQGEARFVRVSREQAEEWRESYGAAEGSVFDRAASRNSSA